MAFDGFYRHSNNQIQVLFIYGTAFENLNLSF